MSKTWKRIVAESFTATFAVTYPTSADLLEQLLTAAEELKSAKLRILLARCYEIITQSVNTGEVANPDDGFEKELLDAIK